MNPPTNSNRALLASVAGFAALGFVIMALIYWAVLATPAFSFDLGTMDWTLRILIIAAIVSFSVYLLVTPESVGRAAAKRSNRLGANAVVASLVAVAIGIVANMIIENVPAVRADWTAGQDFTLSAQTIKLLEGLSAQNSNVTAVAFFEPQSRQQAEDLLKEYASHSSHLKYEFVDPINAPVRAAQYGVTHFGVVAFDNGKKREVAEAVSERDFTSALIRLSQTGVKSVVFLSGHGERDPNSVAQDGLSEVRQSLEQNNYKVRVQSLVTATINVSDTTVLVIAQPMRPYTTKEVQQVQAYLDAGGHALILLDPRMTADVVKPMATILAKYGVTPVSGGAVDLQKTFTQDGTDLGADTYPVNAVTDALGRSHLTTRFPLAMAVNPPTSTVAGYVTSPMVQTSGPPPISWLESDIQFPLAATSNNIQIRYDAGKDQPGPLTLALSIAPEDTTAATATPVTNTQTTQAKARLVVFGDADFAGNALTNAQVPYGNRDLFGNSISWLAGANELVSIRAKDQSTPRTISLDVGQRNLAFTTTVLGMPLLVLLVGAFIWWRRR